MGKRSSWLGTAAFMLASCGGGGNDGGTGVIVTPTPSPTPSASPTPTPTPSPTPSPTPTPPASPVANVGAAFRISPASAMAAQPVVAALASGGYVVVWQEAGSTGSVQSAIYNAAGVQQRTVRVSAAADASISPAVAALDTGGYAVVWLGAGTVHSQAFDDAGERVGADLRAGTANPDGVPVIADLTGAGYVLAWVETPLAGSYVVRFQLANDGGTSRGASVSAYGGTGGISRYPGPIRLATLSQGRFVLTFGVPFNSGQNRTEYQVRTAAGELARRQVTVANYNFMGTPAIAQYGSGFALYGVEALAQGSPGSLRIYNPDDENAVIGTRSTRQLPRAAATTVSNGRVLVVGAGGFAYETVSSPLYGILIDGAGSQVGTDTVIGGSTDVATPAVATLRDGRVVAVWTDRTTNAIIGQYLTVAP